MTHTTDEQELKTSDIIKAFAAYIETAGAEVRLGMGIKAETVMLELIDAQAAFLTLDELGEKVNRLAAENERLRGALKSLVDILAKKPGKEITRRDKNDMIQLAWERGVDALEQEQK